MHFTVEKTKFNPAIQWLASVAGAPNEQVIIEASVSDDGSGVITLFSTEAHSLRRSRIPAEVTAPGRCAVYVGMVELLTSRITATKFTAELVGNTLECVSGRTHFSFQTVEENPTVLDMSQQKIHGSVDAQDIRWALSSTGSCVAKERNAGQETLMGVRMTPRTDETGSYLDLVGATRFTACYVTIPLDDSTAEQVGDDDGPEEFRAANSGSVPPANLLAALGALGDTVKFATRSGHLGFIDEDSIAFDQAIAGKPLATGHIKASTENYTNRVVVNRDELIGKLQLLAKFVTRSGSPDRARVILSLNTEEGIIRLSNNREAGGTHNMEDFLDATVAEGADPKDITLGAEAINLLSLLSGVRTSDVELAFNEPTRPFVVKEHGSVAPGTSFYGVSMPISI